MENVLEKVERSTICKDWAPPTVNVLKPDRSIHICCHFQTTDVRRIGACRKWNENEENILIDVKHYLTNQAILTNFDEDRKTIPDRDVSGIRYGALLLQRSDDVTERSVCLASRALSKSERNLQLSLVQKAAIRCYVAVNVSIDDNRSSADFELARRTNPFHLENFFSMGLKNGLYAGK
ncbi:hypothetical protein RF11_01671 [Thelohanellus kitauei]|uniref:Reverse transcriptase/retrotransposon-derived protein RNase H-like domain-containing protein n=1 Tax=Thelohanellus kitauei TaxID=669202 RepID=A0A0C2MKP7_THEKT|nr:hypothetical protein RF11_01671 [Thelohanellus kitauei]